jgi:hypothetical protein
VKAAADAASRESALLEEQLQQLQHQRQQMKRQKQQRNAPPQIEPAPSHTQPAPSPPADAEVQRQLVTLRLRLALGNVCECMRRTGHGAMGNALRKWTALAAASFASAASAASTAADQKGAEGVGVEEDGEEGVEDHSTGVELQQELQHRIIALEQELAAVRSASTGLAQKGDAVRRCMVRIASATKRHTLWKWRAVVGGCSRSDSSRSDSSSNSCASLPSPLLLSSHPCLPLLTPSSLFSPLPPSPHPFLSPHPCFSPHPSSLQCGARLRRMPTPSAHVCSRPCRRP